MEKEHSKNIEKNDYIEKQKFVKDRPSPPSEIASDRPLERLIFGVAVWRRHKKVNMS